MKWTPTKWKRPKTGEKPLMVRFRNGVEGGPYVASALRWTDTDHPFDVVEVARA
jgi:hypothetical protein